MAPLRIGIMGCASIAVRKVLPAMAASPRTEITAIASRNPGKAAEIAHAYGCRAVEGYSALLDLDEVEAMTREIVVLWQGQLLAQGDLHAIRALIDRHPHHVSLTCDAPRRLAAALVALPSVRSVSVREPDGLELQTNAPDECYAQIPRVALELGVTLRGLTSPDDNLAAVFRYLTAGPRGLHAAGVS